MTIVIQIVALLIALVCVGVMLRPNASNFDKISFSILALAYLAVAYFMGAR